jgi:hypothetical protein
MHVAWIKALRRAGCIGAEPPQKSAPRRGALQMMHYALPCFLQAEQQRQFFNITAKSGYSCLDEAKQLCRHNRS